ncbi:MAG TPA: undecaprenyl-diphosphatase UppP [Moorella mulderi]|nr:undecaprenyl-diphosphatase UppP [Moorella mulderi]
MSLIQAIVLGIVQGVSEFLPISSTAHLILVPWFLGWEDPGLTFDVALHLGTLVAVLSFFWREVVDLVRQGLTQPQTGEGRLFWYLVVASVPGALAGYLLEAQAETAFRSPLRIAWALALLGFLLWWADRWGRKLKTIEDISLKDSLLIGLSQALAIMPGVSRSGITMTAGLILGLTRESSARFSFLMSIPIIAGAGLLKIKDISPQNVNSAFFLGIFFASLSGFLAIKYLLRYLRHGSYLFFAWYRLVLAAATMLYLLTR